MAINAEITSAQTELRRESVHQRRIFDMELNELKYQLDGISSNNGTPAIRIKAAEIREKISDLKYKYNLYVVEREAKDAKLANERVRRNAQNQLEYENAEIIVCKAIRNLGGFNEFGMPKKNDRNEVGKTEHELNELNE